MRRYEWPCWLFYFYWFISVIWTDLDPAGHRPSFWLESYNDGERVYALALAQSLTVGSRLWWLWSIDSISDPDWIIWFFATTARPGTVIPRVKPLFCVLSGRALLLFAEHSEVGCELFLFYFFKLGLCADRDALILFRRLHREWHLSCHRLWACKYRARLMVDDLQQNTLPVLICFFRMANFRSSITHQRLLFGALLS